MVSTVSACALGTPTMFAAVARMNASRTATRRLEGLSITTGLRYSPEYVFSSPHRRGRHLRLILQGRGASDKPDARHGIVSQ